LDTSSLTTPIIPVYKTVKILSREKFDANSKSIQTVYIIGKVVGISANAETLAKNEMVAQKE